MTGSGKVRKKKWNDLSCLLIIFFFSLLVVEIDETRASRSCSSIGSVKVSLFYSSFLHWWLWAWIPQCKTCPHFLWDTENAIEKALNACASSTCYSLCHWQLRQLRIFYVMQSLLISALRLIFSSLICFFKRLCWRCSLFYTRWRLSLVAMENDEGILFHVDQPAAAAAATNETTWGMPGENWRHILCLFKLVPLLPILHVSDCIDGTLGLETL